MLDQADEARRARTTRNGPRLDFQDHLADLEAAGLVTRIDTPINKDTELHPLAVPDAYATQLAAPRDVAPALLRAIASPRDGYIRVALQSEVAVGA